MKIRIDVNIAVLWMFGHADSERLVALEHLSESVGSRVDFSGSGPLHRLLTSLREVMTDLSISEFQLGRAIRWHVSSSPDRPPAWACSRARCSASRGTASFSTPQRRTGGLGPVVLSWMRGGGPRRRLQHQRHAVGRGSGERAGTVQAATCITRSPAPCTRRPEGMTCRIGSSATCAT